LPCARRPLRLERLAASIECTVTVIPLIASCIMELLVLASDRNA
jgi:hypothetical protein